MDNDDYKKENDKNDSFGDFNLKSLENLKNLDSEQLKKHLKSQIATLESKMDVFESELSGLDAMLKEGGFEGGVASLKSAIEDLISQTKNISFPKE